MSEYNDDFIKLLNKLLHKNFINICTNLDNNTNINKIIDIILSLSIVNNKYYILPKELIDYFKILPYVRCTKFYIRRLVKSNLTIKQNTNFLDNYLIVGNDIPNIIDNLNIIID